MTPEQQRIAIADASGWRRIGTEKNLPLYGWIEQGPCEEIPDYLNDLNAMHEAEKVLEADRATGKGGWSDYNTWLQFISDRDGKPKWHATAAQRAEAALRTLGKWKDF